MLQVQESLKSPEPNKAKCPYCGQQHNIFACSGFKTLSVQARIEKVKTKKLCYNCLGSDHMSAHCRSKHRCRRCQSKHHMLLHKEVETVSTPEEVAEGSSLVTSSVAAASRQHAPGKGLSSLLIGTSKQRIPFLDGFTSASTAQQTTSICLKLAPVQENAEQLLLGPGGSTWRCQFLPFHSRDTEGRYIVSLPRHDPPIVLGKSRTALKHYPGNQKSLKKRKWDSFH